MLRPRESTFGANVNAEPAAHHFCAGEGQGSVLGSDRLNVPYLDNASHYPFKEFSARVNPSGWGVTRKSACASLVQVSSLWYNM